MGLSVSQAAEAMGVPETALSDLLSGNVPLSPEIALNIEQAFGVSKDLLLRMQDWYDASQADARAAAVAARRP